MLQSLEPEMNSIKTSPNVWKNPIFSNMADSTLILKAHLLQSVPISVLETPYRSHMMIPPYPLWLWTAKLVWYFLIAKYLKKLSWSISMPIGISVCAGRNLARLAFCFMLKRGSSLHLHSVWKSMVLRGDLKMKC